MQLQENTWNGLSGEFQKKEFKDILQKKKNVYKINETLKRNVQFIENNLLSTLYFNEFDLILCRNVFIYFDDHSKKIIIDKFEKALVDNGYLLIGHSEAAHLIPNTFQSIQFQKSFVYQKTMPKIENNRLSNGIPTISTQENKQTYIPKASIEPIDINRKLESETVLKAKEYADAGKVTEAESLVKEILRANPSNFEALFLQGQILEAHGLSLEAVETYKKVIYLNPLFLESYLTLSSLYSLLHNTSESLRVRKAGLSCLQNNENLKKVYKEKGYHIESLESFFSEESGLWL